MQNVEPNNDSLSKNVTLEEFGWALSKVLEESPEARTLLKNEALKKINFDYDVLYLLVKDIELNDGSTLKGLLSKHADKSTLEMIENQIPTLTIFVPSLPNKSFSAEVWNVDIDKPHVAIDIKEEGKVLYIKNTESFYKGYDEIPLFPVVVVKKNERIIERKLKAGTDLKNNIEGTNLYFIDGVFNKQLAGNKIVKSSGRGPSFTPNTKTIEAYNKTKSNNGWQRDYIYYNIVNPQDRGAFNKRYIEKLVGFRILPTQDGRGKPIYDKLADQTQTGDPVYGYFKDKSGRHGYRWTSGDFEFQVRVILGSKSPTGNESVKYFFAKPDDLFYFVYETVGSGRGSTTDYTKIKDIACQPGFYNPNLELFAWDLNVFSSQYKIEIEEVDSDEETTQTSTTTYEYATNFNFDVTKGETIKIGSKFGASAKATFQTAFTLKIKKGSDKLGDVIIDFGEPLINSSTGTSYDMYKYGTGGNFEL